MRIFGFFIFCLFGYISPFHAQVNELTGSFGTIVSPGFPEPYGNDLDITWRIVVRTGYKVKLYFSSFNLEDSYEDDIGACAYDYVQIDGERRFCGNSKQFPQDAPLRPIYSSGNVMVVRFVSDYSNEEPFYGFQAHYTEEDVDECWDLINSVNSGVEDWDEILYCNHFCHNVPGSYYCSCRHGFTLNTNQHTCVADCETEVVVEEDGFLQSSDYPRPYSKLSRCETTIRAGTGKRFNARFDEVFGIEEHYEEGCVYDWIEVTDDADVTHRFCGNTAPENGSSIATDASTLRLYFHSDLTTEKSGYKLHYTVHRVKCLEELLAPPNGNITKPDKDVYEYEDEIEFSCKYGYRLVGSAVSKCNENGNWSTPTPTCNIKHCPRPDDLLTIPRTLPPQFDEDERPFNSSVVIDCINQWYELVSGAAEWFCDDDETWHFREPVIAPNPPENLPECRPICGIKNAEEEFDYFLQVQIILGIPSRNGEWPWMAFVALRGENIEANMSFCGGSLVDEQYVVTAAHCIRSESRLSMTVYLGVTDRFNVSNATMQIFNVIQANYHPGHGNAQELDNLYDDDIAVLKLDRKAVIGRFVRPICIPRSMAASNLPLVSPRRGAVIGWGLNEDNQTQRVLQKVRVPYVNQTECVAAYHRHARYHPSYNHIRVSENQFCAGFLNLAKDSCTGDSGGPLMWRDGNRRWYLNGIVSTGTSLAGCRRYSLGIYTNVTNYHEYLDGLIVPDP